MPGVGPLQIGISQGGAQVFNPSPAIAQYGQISAQKQAKHDAEVKDLAETLARGYDPSGLRSDTDRTNYIKKYNDIKADAIGFENEKDPTKRALGIAQIRQRLSDLGAYAEGSKKQAIADRQMATLIAEHPHMFSPDAIKKVKDGLTKEYTDPDVPKSPLDLARGVDPEKVFASYEKLKKPILEQAQFDNGVKGKPYTLAGKTYQDLNKKAGIPINGDNGALEHVLAWASSDDDAKLYLQQAYPDIKGNNEQSTLALRALKFMHDQGDDQGFYKYKQERGEAREPLRHTLAEEQFFKNHGFWPETGQGTAGQNATAIIAENMRVSGDPSKFVPLIKNTLPKEQWAKGQDVQASTDVDPQTGQTVHVFKFPDKVEPLPKAQQANATAEARYKQHPQKRGSTLGFGGTPIPYKESDQYQKDVAAGRYFPNPTKTIKDNSKPYRIPTGDPQAYGIGVADMLKEQGASEAEIQKILGKTGVNPVKLGQKPKATEPALKIDPNVKYY